LARRHLAGGFSSAIDHKSKGQLYKLPDCNVLNAPLKLNLA
jgi:hypothetical protein